MREKIAQEMRAHLNVAQKIEALAQPLEAAAKMIIAALKNGKKLLICGNGGSAADSQHFAAELSGRYKRERKGIAALALSVDTSALTAIGNDYGFEFVFSRQVEALAQEGDVLFGISTSGNSANVIQAAQVAKQKGVGLITLTGRDGGRLKDMSDVALVVADSDTPRIQEMHILLIHILCDLIEQECGA